METNEKNTILENQMIVFSNLLMFSGEVNQKDSMSLQSKIVDICGSNNARPSSNITISAMKNMVLKDGQQFMDMEMYVPVDKEITDFNGYDGFSFLPEFTVENALKLEFKGNQNEMQFCVQRLIDHIKENHLFPDSPLYTIVTMDQEVIESKGAVIKGFICVSIKQ